MSRQHSLVHAIALVTSTLAAFPASNSIAQDTPQIESMIVTGTRASNRTAFDTLAPIDILAGAQIEGTVSSDLSDSLAQLIPSFTVQRLPMADGQVFVRPAQLRNLSPDQTLVLVNGKRRHRSAHLTGRGSQAVDLAQIPSSAIKRVEVLRDGASAQYGSDAIAGVINIILDDTTGFSSFAQLSEYYEGDGQQMQAGARAGFDFGTEGVLSVFAEYTDADLTSRSRQRPDAIVFQTANPQLAVPDPVQRWGKPQRDALRAGFNVFSALNARSEVYAFATYGQGSGVSDFNWRNPVGTSAYRTTPLDPAYNLFAIFPTGFAPKFGQDDTDVNFAAGLRSNGESALFWDISATTGKNEIDYFIRETINASLGSKSPTAFRAGILAQSDLNLNADASYALKVDGLNQPINLAFGLERREETYEIKAGDLASYQVGPLAAVGLPSGANGFPGYSDRQAGKFDQQSWAAYVDIEAELSEALTVGSALRYEDYSDFGDTTDYKLSARYAFTEDFALRATMSSGFRAPTPGQLESERTSQGLNTTTLNLVTSGRFNPTGPVANIINSRPAGQVIRPLQAETSDNLSIGLTYRTNAGLLATIDAYRVDVMDRFSSRGGFQLTNADRQQLSALGIPGGESITNVAFFQNVFDTRTQGIDLVVSYGADIGGGRINLTGALNLNSTEVIREDVAGVFNNVSRRIFEDSNPSTNASSGVEYAIGQWTMTARARYYGSWTDTDDSADVIYQDFGAETFVDAAVAYAFESGLTLRVGAENIFDSYPDEARKQANRGLIYSRNSPYDTDGGKYYLRLNWDL
jgi:iron complex outermembrane receptor protein